MKSRRIPDGHGNFLVINGRHIELELKGMARPIYIGMVSQGILIIKRPKRVHYFRNLDGWGFNRQLFEDANCVEIGFHSVRFIVPWKNINVLRTVEEMRAAFKPMPHFKNQGFERQMCLTAVFFGSTPEQTDPTKPTPPPRPPVRNLTTAKAKLREAQLTLF